LVLIIGYFKSSTHNLADQSPTVKKYLGATGDLWIEYIGPKCLPVSKPYLVVISTLFFNFLLTVNTKPYSVPTKYLLGPASLLYSRLVPPINP